MTDLALPQTAVETSAASFPESAAPLSPPLPRVRHTPQMVVKVRDCPTSHMPIELCYQCFGDPSDGLPPVLLICGLNMQLYAWDEAFCEALVRAGFYVIRYDNRDMGHSTKIEHRGRVKAPLLLLPGGAATWLGEKLPYSTEDMAADAWALLDTLHLPCAHLFGISMGGMIAQTAALLAPERTISLTSVMSSTNAPDLPQPQLWVKLWMLRKPPRHCTVDELLEFRVNSLRRLLRSALPPDGEYLKKRYLMSLKRSSYSAGLVRQAATIRRAAGRDAKLQQLYVPALVVHGAQDVVVPPMHGYRTATMLPYARMLVLKSMGHYFHPAFFPTIIEAFADMAASTDSAKRGLGSRLPSASAMALVEVAEPARTEDGNAAAAAAWRRGGGAVTSSHAGRQQPSPSSTPAAPQTDVQGGSGDRRSTTTTPANSEKVPTDEASAKGDAPLLEEEEEDEDAYCGAVDPQTVMMASMGAFIQPVVADASSPVGAAACRSVMVAVPGGNSNPGVPEAVIVENVFLRTPHAVPSMPAPTVVKKPLSSPATSPTTALPAPLSTPSTAQLRNSNNSNGGYPAASTAAAVAARGSGTSPATSPTGSTGSAHSPGKPLYVSPLAGEERRRAVVAATGSVTPPTATAAAPAAKPAPMDGATPYVPCSPSRWHDVAPFPQRSTATRKNSVSNNGSKGISGPAAYPQFHPIVAGVSLRTYLDAHPMERETSGLAMTANATASEAKTGDGKFPHGHGSFNEASWTSGTALQDAAPPARWAAGPPPPAASAAEAHAMGGEPAGSGIRSPSSQCSSQERRENESFLQAQAPEEVVEATTLPSL